MENLALGDVDGVPGALLFQPDLVLDLRAGVGLEIGEDCRADKECGEK